MTKVIRISLPGYDATTDTDPNHYALYADQDNVLLKEHSRGTLTPGGSVSHNLGYIPFYLAYGNIGGNKYQLGTGFDAISGVPRSRSTPNTLKTVGYDFKYFIFYDNMD